MGDHPHDNAEDLNACASSQRLNPYGSSLGFDPYDPALPSPAYVVDVAKIRSNLTCLRGVAEASGAKILLAQKAFSLYHLYPLIGDYLSGTTASSLHEARLGAEEMPGAETHIFSPAFIPAEFSEIVNLCDHIVFNSPSQIERFREQALSEKTDISLGLRLNPEFSTQKSSPLYDPCAAFSRLGTTRSCLDAALAKAFCMDGIEGLHMHTLCEQNSDDLQSTLVALEAQFSDLLEKAKWLNLGGGHHITRPDYDIDRLIFEIRRLRERYQVEIYLEPGEAIALDAAYLLTEVLDFVSNGMEIALLDSSAECHMPDVLAMPYRPSILSAEAPGVLPYTYRLSSCTCLAGDVSGDYSFPAPLHIGDRLLFCDMAIYSMVKNNTFNGINLPAIVLLEEDGSLRCLKKFGYHNFKARL